MKTIHELLNGKVVNCKTKDEASKLLRIISKYEIPMTGREYMILWFNWDIYKSNTCYILEENKVLHSDRDFYENEMGLNVLSFEEFEKDILNKFLNQ